MKMQRMFANARMSITISGVPKLRLNKDGLGLSTTTPRAELDVNGSAIIEGDLNVTGNISSGNGFTGSCVNTTYLNGIAIGCND